MKKHIVMVPGFCGFDGLGDLNYYAGTMEVFERFRAASAEPVALHYFDNFPTASVAVRANRLRLFLVKMMQRGAIQPGEPIALVGHSTGGLDIRKLLWDLARTEKAKGDPQAQQQEPDLLGAIRRVVLLSVPHYGSHLADAIAKHQVTFQALAGLAAQLVGAQRRVNRTTLARLVESFDRTGSELALAVADALTETDEAPANDDVIAAHERECRAQLTLWLNHMARDFGAVRDLQSAPPRKDAATRSPAHFDDAERRAELAQWRALDLRWLSVITRAPAPPSRLAIKGARRFFTKGPILPAPGARIRLGAWLLRPVLGSLLAGESTVGYLAAVPAVGALGSAVATKIVDVLVHWASKMPAGQDPVYQLAHAVLTHEPFPIPDASPELAAWCAARNIDTSSGDGIVNTTSMLYPFNPDVPLDEQLYTGEDGETLSCDHGDIIGHFRLRTLEGAAPGERQRAAYDVFHSGSGFDDKAFDRVWTHIFHFCVAT